jgi:hypothetical protein
MTNTISQLLSRRVLCRELAIAREADVKQTAEDSKAIPTKDANEDIEMVDDPAPPAASLVDVIKQDTTKPETNADEDIIMEDAKPSTDEISKAAETTTTSDKPDSKASNLNINTNFDSKPTDDAAPMTANTDLESLFQDADDDAATDSKPLQNSADTSVAKGEDDPFSFDASSTAKENLAAKGNPTAKENPAATDDNDSTFRSSANNGDNDNLSSLLPGLQDYANTDGELDGSFGGDNGETGGMSNTEFDALFGDSTDAFGGGGDGDAGADGGNNASGGNDDPFAAGAGDGEAFNFEAFMNSTDFDTAGHNAAAGAVAGGGNGQGGGDGSGGGEDNGLDGMDGQAFDFDSIFQ